MQICWSIEKKEMKEKVAIYKAPSARSTAFITRPSIRSRRVKVWTPEQIAERNSTRVVKG
jgi:hypothetical protein